MIAFQLILKSLRSVIKPQAWLHFVDSYAEPLFKNALARASQMECINGLLLQGRVLRHYATLLCGRGEYKRAQECIRGAKQKLFNAAPSFERASVGYTAAT